MDMDDMFCHDLRQGNYETYVDNAINNPEKYDEIRFHCVNDFIEEYVNDYRKRLYEAFDEYIQNCKDNVQ